MLRKAILSWISTARRVEATRRSLFASLSDPARVPPKAAAYAAAVRLHRQRIFAEALRDVRPGSRA
ncbi:MAG: hypothetical protein JST11_15700 [Acidobacteria bacterium]|nr:hypothetical protein [Acidobacteriota bacterium]